MSLLLRLQQMRKGRVNAHAQLRDLVSIASDYQISEKDIEIKEVRDQETEAFEERRNVIN
jgi:hypothetical protein